jgi:site-specific DNA recombinase
MYAPETFQGVPAYARLSKKAKGGQIESIELQLATMDRLAEVRGDTIAPDLRFADKHLSAWDTDVFRPAWEAFLLELDTGKHRAAYSYHADRLSRNGMDCERLLQIGERWSIILITPEGIYDLGNGDSRSMFRHLAAMTINQSDATSRRVRNHKDEARREGLLRDVHGGVPPLGFRQGTDDWDIDPEQAAWLAQAAARVLAGESVRAVLRTMPPMTDALGRPVTEKMLRNALARPASAGLITTREGQVTNRREGGGPLSEDTFARLQLLFEGRKVGRPAGAATADDQGRARYPYGPVMRCGKCGNQLTGNPGYKHRGYYGCRNPHKIDGVTVEPCRGVSIAAEDVHELIRAIVAEWATTPAAKAAAARSPETAGRRAELDADIADLAMQLARLEGRRLDARSQIVRFEYDGLIAEADARIATAEGELAELARIDADPGVPVVIDWDAMTDAERLRVLAEAVELPIVVLPGKGGPRPTPAVDRVILTPRH